MDENMTMFDAPGLRHFITTDDRYVSPVFVGREDVIKTIDDTLDLIRWRRQNRSHRDRSAKGLMRLVQGAPGIGKTSLLDRMKDRCWERLEEGTSSHKVIPLVIDAGEMSFQSINREIRMGMQQAWDRIGNEEVRVAMRTILDHVRDIDFFGLRLGRSGTEAIKPLRLPDHCTLLLMIDEIQNLSDDPHDESARVLRNLEDGSHGQAILPVLAGLSNSVDRLMQKGLSRHAGRSAIGLRPLTFDQVILATRRFITRFHIQSMLNTQLLWERTLWRWSQGWPKHLQNGLSALGDHLLATDGDLDAVDIMAVQCQVVTRRIRYYWTRFGPHQRRQPALLGHVMARLGPHPVTAATIQSTIRDVMQMGNWDETPPPEWEDMLRLGLIDVARIDAGGIMYGCPIPSLQSFAVTCTAQPSARLIGAVMDGNSEALAEELRAGADIDGRDGWGRTAMHLAAHGASIEAQDQWGRTPLHLAAGVNAEQSLATLIGLGASSHATDQQGWTPLHLAAHADSVQSVGLLMTAGSPVDARNRAGQTARDLAPDGSASQTMLSDDGGGWSGWHGRAVMILSPTSPGNPSIIQSSSQGYKPLKLSVILVGSSCRTFA